MYSYDVFDLNLLRCSLILQSFASLDRINETTRVEEITEFSLELDPRPNEFKTDYFLFLDQLMSISDRARSVGVSFCLLAHVKTSCGVDPLLLTFFRSRQSRPH